MTKTEAAEKALAESKLLVEQVEYVSQFEEPDEGDIRHLTELAKSTKKKLAAYDSFPVEAEAGENALRPEVLAFAYLMEQKLKENDHKGGWDNCEENYLLKRLKEEAFELERVCDQVGDSPKHKRPKVGLEAADVANFAMMLADIYGALPHPPKDKP